MLPETDFCTEKLQVSGFCRIAVEVGGDYYDYISRSDKKLGIIICDVTGHGFYLSLCRHGKELFARLCEDRQYTR